MFSLLLQSLYMLLKTLNLIRLPTLGSFRAADLGQCIAICQGLEVAAPHVDNIVPGMSYLLCEESPFQVMIRFSIHRYFSTAVVLPGGMIRESD